MKKNWLLLIVLIPFGIIAQSSGFGIKAGLNYSSNGNLVQSVSNAAEDLVKSSNAKTGYHIGIFGKIKIPSIGYFKPELVYTTTTSEYDGTKLKIDKIDAPILVGLSIIGPLSFFAGPSLEYILNNNFELDATTLKDIENKFSIGLHLGLGVNLKKIGLDVRYERGFSKNEVAFIQNNVGNNTISDGRFDTRPSQIILGISIKL